MDLRIVQYQVGAGNGSRLEEIPVRDREHIRQIRRSGKNHPDQLPCPELKRSKISQPPFAALQIEDECKARYFPSHERQQPLDPIFELSQRKMGGVQTEGGRPG